MRYRCRAHCSEVRYRGTVSRSSTHTAVVVDTAVVVVGEDTLAVVAVVVDTPALVGIVVVAGRLVVEPRLGSHPLQRRHCEDIQWRSFLNLCFYGGR